MHVRIIRRLLFVFAAALLSMSATSFGAVGIVVSFAPPPLPVYEQPVCPGDGYIWTPGYWGWGDDFDDYYWVPGTWVLAPEEGFLWTPGYWGWGDGGFTFYDGYWGPVVGFYGGIDYGFGYFGGGFDGGRWENGHFFYNRAVMNVNVTEIHNVYETRVNERTVNHVSYNGGEGGITARPTPAEEAAAHERHVGRVAAQTQQMEQAHGDPQQRASANHGKPAVAATPRPGDFKGHGVVEAREAGGEYKPPANRGGNMAREENNAGHTTAGHVRELPPMEKLPAPNTGNAKLDKKYQQQQEKLYKQQEKERQKVAKQQEKEDQKAAKQNEAARQQVERRHQQQTQQLQQRHQEQRQQMQARIQAPPRGVKPH